MIMSETNGFGLWSLTPLTTIISALYCRAQLQGMTAA